MDLAPLSPEVTPTKLTRAMFLGTPPSGDELELGKRSKINYRRRTRTNTAGYINVPGGPTLVSSQFPPTPAKTPRRKKQVVTQHLNPTSRLLFDENVTFPIYHDRPKSEPILDESENNPFLSHTLAYPKVDPVSQDPVKKASPPRNGEMVFVFRGKRITRKLAGGVPHLKPRILFPCSAKATKPK